MCCFWPLFFMTNQLPKKRKICAFRILPKALAFRERHAWKASSILTHPHSKHKLVITLSSGTFHWTRLATKSMLSSCARMTPLPEEQLGDISDLVPQHRAKEQVSRGTNHQFCEWQRLQALVYFILKQCKRSKPPSSRVKRQISGWHTAAYRFEQARKQRKGQHKKKEKKNSNKRG